MAILRTGKAPDHLAGSPGNRGGPRAGRTASRHGEPGRLADCRKTWAVGLTAACAFIHATPSRPGAKPAVGFEALQLGFFACMTHSAHYNKVYGSPGAVMAVLFFACLTRIVFLSGAEVAFGYPRLRPP